MTSSDHGGSSRLQSLARANAQPAAPPTQTGSIVPPVPAVPAAGLGAPAPRISNEELSKLKQWLIARVSSTFENPAAI